MLDTGFILWLQQSASPTWIEIMRAVSIVGYVPSCLAIALVCGFGTRLRLGVTLVLAIAFADAMTVAAKSTFESPRPHAVDARVRAFDSGLSRFAASTAVPADDYGFPSGHVATTAAWALGLAWSRRRPWPLAAASTWIALMALSRMTLGRHFPADVVGGVFVGIAGVTIARHALPPPSDGADGRATDTRTALGLALVAFVALAALVGAGLGPHDAGRFCGLAGAALLLARTRALDEAVPRWSRVARAAVALVLLGVALWSSTWTVPGGPALVVATMAISAALHAGVLLVPALALGGHRA